MFSYVALEDRVPSRHPLRLIRLVVDEVVASMDGDFAALYAATGRPSVPPERVLKALLLQAFYTVRSERQLMEQLDYNLLFRWFVGLGIDDAVWHPTVFSKNRDRLLEGDIAQRFLAAVTGHAKVRGLLSDEHFSVDGTLIEAWASVKSFRPKEEDDGPSGPGRNAERDFHGERRSNETHASTTDPDARLYCGFRRSRPAVPISCRPLIPIEVGQGWRSPSGWFDLSGSGGCGQAATARAAVLRRLSPCRRMRWALCTRRSRMASARVGSPINSCQRSTGTWLVTRVAPRP